MVLKSVLKNLSCILNNTRKISIIIMIIIINSYLKVYFKTYHNYFFLVIIIILKKIEKKQVYLRVYLKAYHDFCPYNNNNKIQVFKRVFQNLSFEKNKK